MSLPQQRTFGNQNRLPSLPVADLRKVLEKYLDSVRVHLLPAEYERTKRLVDEFGRGVGAELYQLLLKHAKDKRNWLEQWWEEYAYHIPRYPIQPLANFGGAAPNYQNWPPCDGSAIRRAALSTYWILKYWELVRNEHLPAQMYRGEPWCMNQTHRLFNTCRIPGERKDQLKFAFKSVYDGASCPSHIVVMHSGAFWRVQITDPGNGNTIYTPDQLEAWFQEIERRSTTTEVGKKSTPLPIGALTCLERTDWYKERQRLIGLSFDNGNYLNVIEESIFVLSFTDQAPENDNQLAYHGLCPHPYFSWADKNLVWHVHKNGMITSNCDHSYVDALVVIQMTDFVNRKLEENDYRWKGNSSKSENPPRLRQLKFATDSGTADAIGRAVETWRSYADDVALTVWRDTSYGTERFKKLSVYGDTMVQLALQMAYYRSHRRPAPTYETAATRKYYHGRTETVRSCTTEAIDWVKSMLSPEEGMAIQRQKFDAAVRKHNRLMAESMNGDGCDRILFALRILAEKAGLPTPEIYTDPGWKKSGGDGNFILSSSFLGYTSQSGSVAAMCTDGYGIFYGMLRDRITVTITAWKSSSETDVELFRENLEYAMSEIRKLLENTTPSNAKY